MSISNNSMNMEVDDDRFKMPYVKPKSCPNEKIEDDGLEDDKMNVSENGELSVFYVFDEYVSDDEINSKSNAYSSDSDISHNEIDIMLEEGLENERSKSTEKKIRSDGTKPVQYKVHENINLEELGYNHFDILPENWVQITHKSGMPLYLHNPTRVCTFSRPYYLGKANAHKHAVPLSAITCLQYKKALDEEAASKTESRHETEINDLRTAKLETAEKNMASQSLEPFAIHQYCKNLFRFKTSSRLDFTSCRDRRRFFKAKRNEKYQRQTFSDNTKLIKFHIKNPEDGPDAIKEWIINPIEKNNVSILQEYIHRAWNKKINYELRALQNPTTPHSATVIINGMRYGYGIGSSKKQAKLAAAKASLEILIPDIREKITNDGNKADGFTEVDASLKMFNHIKIEDPRVAELCATILEPSPYSMLLTCLKRNFDTKKMPIDFKINAHQHHAIECLMTVGSHSARVLCKNKKEGRQRSSQAILQMLHPQLTSWGSLLRLYGNHSTSIIEEKQEEREITMLQSKASLNSPNFAVLDKLRTEMMKLHDKQMEKKPIGILSDDVSLPASGTQLNKIQL